MCKDFQTPAIPSKHKQYIAVPLAGDKGFKILHLLNGYTQKCNLKGSQVAFYGTVAVSWGPLCLLIYI